MAHAGEEHRLGLGGVLRRALRLAQGIRRCALVRHVLEDPHAAFFRVTGVDRPAGEAAPENTAVLAHEFLLAAMRLAPRQFLVDRAAAAGVLLVRAVPDPRRLADEFARPVAEDL